MLEQVKDNDIFKIGTLDVKAVFTPCQSVYLRRPHREENNCRLTLLGHHSTQDHICYFVEDKQKNQRAVFTGCAADRSKICLASPTDTEGHTAETLCSSAVAVAFSKASRGRCTSL